MDKQSNNVVVYGNPLNNVSFNGLLPTDIDIFMASCVLAKDKGTEEIKIDYPTLRQMTRFRNCTNEEFHEQLKQLREKMLRMTIYFEDEEEYGGFVLFQTFRVNKKTKVLTLRAGEDWSHLLNSLNGNFTMFDLSVFVQLNSKYTKTLYRILAQYRKKNGSGWWLADLDDIRRLFELPKGYRNKDILTKIINPSVKELKPFFGTLNFEPIYARKRGKPLEQIRFEFAKATNKPKIEENVTTALPEPKQAKEKKSRKKQTNQFNNFEQRTYTEEQIHDLEKRLLEKSLGNSKELTDEEKKEFETLTKNCTQSNIDDYLPKK